VLYECAAGKPPFVSSSLSELMEMVLGEAPPPLDPAVTHALSPAFIDVVFGLLDKDPARRLDWPRLLAHRFWVESGGSGAGAGAGGGVNGGEEGSTAGGGHADRSRNRNGGLSGSELRALVEASPLPPQPAFDAFIRSASLADCFAASASVSTSPRHAPTDSPNAAAEGAGAVAGGRGGADKVNFTPHTLHPNSHNSLNP